MGIIGRQEDVAKAATEALKGFEQETISKFNEEVLEGMIQRLEFDDAAKYLNEWQKHMNNYLYC